MDWRDSRPCRWECDLLQEYRVGHVGRPGSDSSEIQTNVIGGNLICHDNAPTAQVNQFDGGQVNQIGGNAVGECPPRIVDNPTE